MLLSFVDGTTLHTAFNFDFSNDHVGLGYKKLAEYRENLQDLEIVIIDEMSLMKSDLLYKLHRRLCEVFQSDDLFANKSVILVGDILQLRPVMGNYIFQSPYNDHFKAFHQEVQLWQQFEVFNLVHNHRQGEGNAWANLLNELREGIVTEEAENVLRSRLTDEDHEEFTACHVFYRRIDVSEHNTKMLNKLKNIDLVEIPAIKTMPKGFNSKTRQDGTIDGTHFMNVLSLRVGARVMMISNVFISDGLVNGAMGNVVDFVTNSKGLIECIIVEFESEKCGKQQRNKYPAISQRYKGRNGTPIFRHDIGYQIGKRRTSAKAKVLQFPFTLGWAVTAHKMQGQTVAKGSKLVIHWSNDLIDAMAYVMLGRSECLNDVFIAGKFNTSKITCNVLAKQESDLLKDRGDERKSSTEFFEEGKIYIGFMNIMSLRKHWQDFINDLNFKKCQMTGLCETWLHPDEDVTLPDYHTEMVNVGRGQGIATFNNLQAQIILKHASPLLSTVALQFGKCLVIFLYASQGAPHSDIITMLTKLFENFNDDILVIGDFNWDFLGQSNAIKSFFQHNGFIQLIENPTHEKGGLIDHVYARGKGCAQKFSVYQKAKYYSDHDAIFIKMNPE